MMWFLVIGILLIGLLQAWPPIQAALERTALELANREIIERANDYKQLWLLENQPSDLQWQGQRLTFSVTGWVLPTQVDGKRCTQLLNWLYPKQHILQKKLQVEEQPIPQGYQCELYYTQAQFIKITLQNNSFSSTISSLQ